MTNRMMQKTALMGLIAMVLSCSGSDDGQEADPSGGQPAGPGKPADASCLAPETGCPCDENGYTIECGRVAGESEPGRITCEMGTRVCEDHLWGPCQVGTSLTGQGVGLQPQAPIVITPGNCTIGNPCDPYCRRFAEQSMDERCPGTGRTWELNPNGPPPTSVTDRLTAAGITDEGWYHELDPGDTAVDPIQMTITLSTVDVYFLLNSTDAMRTPIGGIADGLAATITQLQASIPDIAFGVGRFMNYDSWPYGVQTWGNALYDHMVNITANEQLVLNRLTAMKNDASYFSQSPYAVGQSSIPALFAAASNYPLMGRAAFQFGGGTATDAWYDVFKYYGRRSDAYAFRYTTSTTQPIWGGTTCSGGIGAPCFRPGAYHIVLLVQDAPAMNGPAGSFPYYQMKPRYFFWNQNCDYTTENSWYWYYSPSQGGGVPNLGTDHGSAKSTSIPAADVGDTKVHFGNLKTSGTSSSYYINSNGTVRDVGNNVDLPVASNAVQRCNSAMGSGEDTYYDFTVPAGGMRYWFDTVGSAYDTVLYLLNTTTGTVVACNDDAFAYLSMGTCFDTNAERDQGQRNSAILGDLPAGNYRLVVDKYSSGGFPDVPQQDGIYQLNLWPDFDDPFYAGDPAGTAYSTPSYTQSLAQMSKPQTNFIVGAVESSGLSCGQSVAQWEKAFTRWSLEGIAKDTGAIVNGAPLVYSVKQNGTPGCAAGQTCDTAKCPAGASIASVIGSAITSLTNNFAQPISIVGVDFDDGTDFDGVTGVNAGATVLTTSNVDDSTFISHVTANPTAGCTVHATGTYYESCSPGAQPDFDIEFAVPSGVTPRFNTEQIFHFRVEMRGDGGTVLSTQPVTIVVPPAGVAFTPVDVEREFHAPQACAAGTNVVWLDLGWNSMTPAGTKIEFFVRAANTQAGLDTATEISALAGEAHLSPTDTQVESIDLGQFLVNHGFAVSVPYVRIRAHLVPTTSDTPVLYSYAVELDCLP